jgi:hypothetical protein
MALVKCRECDSDISDSAATCPKCGVSAPAGMASLTFIRTGASGRHIPIDVFVDQKPFGKVMGKSGTVVPVSPGSHHIELRSNRKSIVGNFEVTQGNKVLKVSMNAIGGLKLE